MHDFLSFIIITIVIFMVTDKWCTVLKVKNIKRMLNYNVPNLEVLKMCCSWKYSMFKNHGVIQIHMFTLQWLILQGQLLPYKKLFTDSPFILKWKWTVSLVTLNPQFSQREILETTVSPYLWTNSVSRACF